jgi:hypothetical protein
VLIAILGLILSLCANAFAGEIKNGDNPRTTGCDVGAIDVPESARPITIDNELYGELVVRESTECAHFRWAEVRYFTPKGYRVTVELRQEYEAYGWNSYSVTDNEPGIESPVFTNMYDQVETCISYTADVWNPADGTQATVSEYLCELPAAPEHPEHIETPPGGGYISTGAIPIGQYAPGQYPGESSNPVPAQTTPTSPVAQSPKKATKKKAKCKLVRVKVKHSKRTKLVHACPKAKKKSKSSKPRSEHLTTESGGGA